MNQQNQIPGPTTIKRLYQRFVPLMPTGSREVSYRSFLRMCAAGEGPKQAEAAAGAKLNTSLVALAKAAMKTKRMKAG